MTKIETPTRCLAEVRCCDCDAKVGVLWFGGEHRFVNRAPVNTAHGKAFLLHVCLPKSRQPGEDDDR